MDVRSLKAQIQSGELDNVYIFTGVEDSVMDIYIKQIAKVKDAVVTFPDDLSLLLVQCNAMRQSKMRQICVFRDSKDIIQHNDIIAKFDKITQSDSIIIFIFTTLDKRSKLYKLYEDRILIFDRLPDSTISKYIDKGCSLTDKNKNLLMTACEKDYGRILLEIDKIRNFATANNISDDAAFVSLLKDGTIYQEARDAVFIFVDAVLKNNKLGAFALLEECYESGESTLVIISNLYNSAKQLLQVQSYKGDNLATATGLTPFQIKLARNRVGKNRNGDLVYLMKLLREAEVGIKVGTIDDSISVYYVLVQYWG